MYTIQSKIHFLFHSESRKKNDEKIIIVDRIEVIVEIENGNYSKLFTRFLILTHAHTSDV